MAPRFRKPRQPALDWRQNLGVAPKLCLVETAMVCANRAVLLYNALAWAVGSVNPLINRAEPQLDCPPAQSCGQSYLYRPLW